MQLPNLLTKKNLLLLGLLAAAAWLRLWNLADSLQFLGDQGRDALLVADIFRKGDPVFIGPVASVGNLYLGPLYYYFMLPFLLLTYPSPMGPVYAVAGLGISTVFLLYYWGRKLVGEQAALIATAFFTFSATVITYSRFSWNPNPAPLVSLAMLYATYLAIKKSVWYWLAVGVCFSILLQLHYVTLLAGAGAGVVWLWQAWQLRKDSATAIRTFVFATLLTAALVLLSFTPLALFDSRHDGLNRQAFQALLTGEENFKQTTQLPFSQKITATVKETHGRGMHILFEIAIGKNRQLNTALLVFTFVSLLLVLTQNDSKRFSKKGVWVITAYLITGVLGTAFYEHTIFDHYIAYLFPISFLVYGVVLQYWAQKHVAFQLIAALFFAFFLVFNSDRWPLQSLGWTMSDIRRTSQEIVAHLEPDEKYNIVLLSNSGDIEGQNYRYFLSTTEHPPVPTEERGSIDTLVIINEDKKIEKVTDSPIYEIVVFPNKEPDTVYNIEQGPEITILRKTE